MMSSSSAAMFETSGHITLEIQKDMSRRNQSRSTSAGSSSSSHGLGSPDSHGGRQDVASAALPDFDYPVPFVLRRSKPATCNATEPMAVFVKNTFIDSPDMEAFSSLDAFATRREVRSCPASNLNALNIEPHSESAKEPSVRSPLFIKNTFLHEQLEELGSLQDFVQERQSVSAPASFIKPPPGLEAAEGSREHLASWVTEAVGVTTPFHSAAYEYDSNNLHTDCTPSSSWLSCPQFFPAPPPAVLASPHVTGTFDKIVPPPPAAAAPTFEELSVRASQLHTAPVIEPTPPGPQVLRIADELEKQDSFESWNLTDGSKDHALGRCRPCAFLYTKGCSNGRSCQFCHLCPPGEKKRRQREKFNKLKQEQVAASDQETNGVQDDTAGDEELIAQDEIATTMANTQTLGASEAVRPARTVGRWKKAACL